MMLRVVSGISSESDQTFATINQLSSHPAIRNHLAT
jgi:hypothetical protein